MREHIYAIFILLASSSCTDQESLHLIASCSKIPDPKQHVEKEEECSLIQVRMASSGESASKNYVGVEQDGYEPLLLGHDHRNNNKVFNETEIEHPPYTGTSFIRTLFNGLNALSGVGILSIPYALSEGGWSSLILLLMVAIMCCFTGLLLKRCMDVSPNIRSYSDIGELAFGNKGRVLIAVFMYLELYLVAIEFIILESDNLNKLLPNMSFKVFELTIAGKQAFILIAALVILPTTWLRSMTLLAYISAGGALASIIVVVSVLWAGTLDGVGFHGKGRLINLSGFPTAVSLYAFCYCGHAVFPTIYTSMKDRSQFSKMLLLCFLLCTLNYGTMAVIGYLMYGQDLQSQITLNLPLADSWMPSKEPCPTPGQDCEHYICITNSHDHLSEISLYQMRGHIYAISILLASSSCTDQESLHLIASCSKIPDPKQHVEKEEEGFLIQVRMASSGESTSKNHVGVEKDGYEPLLLGHDHRNNNKVCNETEIEHPPYTGTSFIRTLFNGLNALSGVGILSIPYALSEGGWSSLILLLMVAIMCCFTGLLLKRCMDVSPNIRSYSDIGELAFGNKGRVLIAVFMYLELYLVAIEFIILESDNLNKLLPNMSFKVFELTIAGKQAFILIAALVILPTTWLRSMTLLAYISAGGALASIIVVVSVLWAGTLDGVGFHGKGRLINLSGFPTAVSLYAFCYCGHAVFPTIYTSMKDRSQFSKMLLLCFLLCTLNYGTMAVIGYLMYGQDLQSQITLNLPLGKISSLIAISTTLINPFTKYGLMITPVANAIEERFQIYNNRAMCLFIRTLLVISTAIVALTVPFFGYLMALIGSFLSSTVSMVLPCLCYLKICRPSRSAKLELLIICVTLAVGVIVTVVGTCTSVRQIVQHL